VAINLEAHGHAPDDALDGRLLLGGAVERVIRPTLHLGPDAVGLGAQERPVASILL
jgi:hypothetical protein